MKSSVIALLAVAMTVTLSARAQNSEQQRNQESNHRASLGLDFGHRADDSLKVSSLNVGFLTLTDSVKGVQLSSFSNVAEHVSGLQMSSFCNVAYDGLKGMQLSATNNIVIGDVEGFQLSGFTNQNMGTLKGAQVAFRNVTDTLRGVQLGLFNYIMHDYQKGVQIGLVNYSCDTISKRFGIININPNTRIDVMAFAGTNSRGNMALRFRNRSTYNIIGVGTHYTGLDKKFSGAIYYRIGQYLQLTPRLSLSGDVGYSHIETFKEHSTDAPERLYSLEARLNLDYQLGSKWGVFGTVGYGDTRFYRHNERFRHRMIGEVGLTYHYGGYRQKEYRGLYLHSDEDMMSGGDNRFALPQKPNVLRTAAMIFAVNAFVQRWDAWVLDEEYTQITSHTIRDNFKNAFVWDNDNFNTNLFAHPYHGNLYFNSARSNGLNYWQSFPCTVGGSLMWEFFGEITPPAINDLMATTIGGACIGEITFRISDLFYDDRQVGFNRFLRELGGALFSPMKGLKRILTGEAWKVKDSHYLYHDYSRIPVRYSLSLGFRYLADDRALFRGEHNPYLELTVEYGDPYDNEENKPFSYFRSNVTLDFSSSQPLFSRLNLLGRIWGTSVCDTKKFEADFGIFQHFNYYNSEAVKDGTDLIPYRISEAASVGPGLIYRFPQLSERMDLEQRLFLSGILLGGSLSDYLHIQNRDYNMGSGLSAKIQTDMNIRKVGYVHIDADYFHIFTWKGYDRTKWEDKTGTELNYTNAQGDPGNTSIMTFSTNLGLYLSHHLSFDLRGCYFIRRSHYRDFDDVFANTFEIRAGLMYKL
ncbi:MAG: DUF3943 domain-containing protein [Prevotella sp.]|nr:DUF3943 domain-containing protein [Prevotella sp.]